MRTDKKLSVYESIIEFIKRDIALGIIGEGERLPSCRDMAMRLGINPNTVQRAYSELELQGVIYTIPKKGVYIKPLNENALLKTVTDANQNSEAFETVKRLKESGISREEILKIIDEVFKND